jgi:hypothetical protein
MAKSYWRKNSISHTISILSRTMVMVAMVTMVTMVTMVMRSGLSRINW